MDSLQLNLRHLRALHSIVRLGSISAAALDIHLTQPAITQGIARLEAAIGAPLFDRRANGMEPRASAIILSDRVETALKLVNNRRVTSTQMRAFNYLARTGSYTAAAAASGVSQASLHRSVSDLSLAYGFALVERRGRGLALTAKGREIARRFSLARAELDAGLDEIATLGGQETGHIALGAMPLARALVLPRVMAKYHEIHPDVRFVVMEGSHTELIGPLRDGELSIIVGALRGGSAGPDLIEKPLFVDEPVVIASADHPLAGRAASIEELARYPWVMPGTHAPLRTSWEQWFVDAGQAVPTVPIECGSVIIIRQLLMDGNFLTLLSRNQVNLELDAGRLARVDTRLGIRRSIGMTCRAEWNPTRLQRAFIELLEQEIPIIDS
ncbi:MAG: LysR family transcriptional regulator [Sphingopyxis macrogoltabida]|uniref:LysR family transcriptional regulator n=1 Tax=Sphingopyxis macrogoltabida TaxID=33050 RepID=A0A2W5L6R3_SPHMC|nr:MAG: LysR family transcriptional regulator [Sphingopyxis macrogoltabida]